MSLKIRLKVELEIESGRVDLTLPEEHAWFLGDILGAQPDSSSCLILHSNELGDTVGTIRVLKIEGIL